MKQQLESITEQDDREIEVRIEWQPEGAPMLVIDSTGDRHVMVVDPRVSHRQIERAVVELGDLGPMALKAWRERLGVSQSLSAN